MEKIMMGWQVCGDLGGMDLVAISFATALPFILRKAVNWEELFFLLVLISSKIAFDVYNLMIVIETTLSNGYP